MSPPVPVRARNRHATAIGVTFQTSLISRHRPSLYSGLAKIHVAVHTKLMSFLVNWLIVLVSVLSIVLYLSLRTPHSRHAALVGHERRVASARLFAQATLGFWTAALIVVRGILTTDGTEAAHPALTSLAFAALGLASVSTYWSVCAVRLRRRRLTFARR
ncbi:conserved membrane protein of unknown function [Burkholderia multivorans]